MGLIRDIIQCQKTPHTSPAYHCQNNKLCFNSICFNKYAATIDLTAISLILENKKSDMIMKYAI